MKKKLIALLLCLMLVASVAIPGTLAVGLDSAESTSEMSVAASAETASVFFGQEYANTVSVPVDGKSVLSVGCTADILSAQWQIYAPAAGVWANIYGETGTTCAVSYAMVRSMLDGEGLAKVRCLVSVADGTAVTQEVSLGVDTSAVPAQNEAPAAEPPVVLSDTVVTANTAEAPAVAAAPAMFSLPQNDEPSGEEPAGEEPAGDEPAADEPAGDEPAGDEPAPLNEPAPTGEESPSTYDVVINYRFENNEVVADPYTASLAAGSNFSATVNFPVVQGYLPYVGEEQLNSMVLSYTSIDQDYTINVVYKPTNVDYTVIHYQQNVDNDQYTEAERETKQGLTNSTVPEVAKTYEGFTALLYEKPAIAADGSTPVEIYYDRNYYLMNFDLDGGYGVEPIYARYGTPISAVGTPTKPGYTFESWTPSIPTVMPDHNTSYKASWKIGESGFTVVFWYENANDDGYSVAGTYKPADVAPGTQKKSEDYKNQSFTGRDDKHFTYNAAKAETVTVKGDGSTVLNVYYTRNTYTLTFKDGQKTLTCTKTEHTHSSDTCCDKSHWLSCNGYGILGRCNANNCPVGYEHTHSDRCYKTSDLTITAKYQADIHGNFPIKDGDETIWWNVPDNCKSFKPGTQLGSIDTMPGENITFTWASADSGAVLWYYVETLNGATGDYTHGGKNFKLYKKIDIEQSGRLTYTEEFHDITGFSQWWSDPAFSKMEQGGTTSGVNKNNYLCYTRNSYNLKFYNYNAYVDGKGGSVQYEAPLSGYYFAPEYPANLEKNAFVFDGWYTTPGCYDGSEVNWDTATMPANDLMLYAKWVPVSHTVEFYLDHAALNAGTKLSTHLDITVRHGSKADRAPETPENGSYTFIGWFYMENGVEKAFDFANMPVTKDMKVYGKWSSNVQKKYTVYYKIQGTDTQIADPTTGSGLADVTKTFEAKGGSELYADYQEGYFPVTKSHSMTLDINATEENDTNVYTFWYVQKEAVPYTVKYLNKETGEPVPGVPEKTVSDNRKAVVTETFVPVSGMMPDAYQKRLVVSAEEGAVNEIIFYYTEDTTHAYYKITHYTENVESGWTEYASSQIVGDVGMTEYSASSLTIPGFTYSKTEYVVKGNDPVTNAPALTTDGLEINLYYTRNSYPYQVRYLEQGSGKQLADPKNGTGKYGQVISESAIGIANYDAVDPTSKTLYIRIEEGTEAKLNIITFYYKEKEVTINYQVVGPDGASNFGSVSPTSETLKVLSGDAQGSTATAKENFRFVGWFKDAGCTQAVDASWVDGSGKLTPQKNNRGLFEAATYYAKFTRKTASLTITKSGANANANDSFIFDVVGNEGSRFTVSVGGNGSVTIAGLPVGETFTVTERNDWSWRYSADSPSVTIQAEGSSVTVTNTVNKSYLLDGSDYRQNNAATYKPNGN
ncbi:MAG: InlB B-repeat-containing protein [Candidatus Limivicinus sp.]|nr:InlB B-repeat-containing protein [Candidatus Limivicinus sp.]